MKNLISTLRANSPQKAEIVFDVLDDIKDQNHFKEGAFLLTDIGQFELKPGVCPALAQLQSLRRDIITPEAAHGIHLLLEQLQHFPRTTSDFSDGLWLQPVFLQHPQDLACLKRRLFHVPRGILLQVGAVRIYILFKHFHREIRSLTPWSASLIRRRG